MGVVEWPDHHCGDDLVQYEIKDEWTGIFFKNAIQIIDNAVQLAQLSSIILPWRVNRLVGHRRPRNQIQVARS